MTVEVSGSCGWGGGSPKRLANIKIISEVNDVRLESKAFFFDLGKVGSQRPAQMRCGDQLGEQYIIGSLEEY